MYGKEGCVHPVYLECAMRPTNERIGYTFHVFKTHVAPAPTLCACRNPFASQTRTRNSTMTIITIVIKLLISPRSTPGTVLKNVRYTRTPRTIACTTPARRTPTAERRVIPQEEIRLTFRPERENNARKSIGTIIEWGRCIY